ncbi:hypothetical protein [Phaeobacter sp. 22II1-1F12B]|uniref:hypothetical protein n=1 Tax=Phaeobacter sp. 22II1-1F12B TaxID=1317111 RepID=UPI000B524BE8|nr:hypothetical protein [Phaeobacter sp. 22II1-1F12B]OWU80438.1 hypothetical protein ATO1_08790 [Phaeobacter sp. 22II1-1F12B]
MADVEKKVMVEFTRDYVVDDERKGTADEESYAKGARKSLVASSAAHFVSRGAAEYAKKS